MDKQINNMDQGQTFWSNVNAVAGSELYILTDLENEYEEEEDFSVACRLKDGSTWNFSKDAWVTPDDIEVISRNDK